MDSVLDSTNLKCILGVCISRRNNVAKDAVLERSGTTLMCNASTQQHSPWEAKDHRQYPTNTALERSGTTFMYNASIQQHCLRGQGPPVNTQGFVWKFFLCAIYNFSFTSSTQQDSAWEVRDHLYVHRQYPTRQCLRGQGPPPCTPPVPYNKVLERSRTTVSTQQTQHLREQGPPSCTMPVSSNTVL